ncbi:cytochrome P450 [Rhizophagus irregularis DAOM 181602=DAOM 197198]|nr:cytochrome P450 [Rhizophagus irregularis DAOM 181602=DAOM 197198]
MNTIIKKMYVVDNTLLDKPLPNDLLTSMITANISRGINYNKIDDKEVMRPMTDLEIRVIIFNGIIAGNDTNLQDDKTRPVTENDFHNLMYREAIVKEVSRISSVNIGKEPNKFYSDKWMIEG